MHDAKNDNPERQIVTMYAPIFRDKLTKLEARGHQRTAEAAELRAVLARIDHAQARLERAPRRILEEAVRPQTHQAA